MTQTNPTARGPEQQTLTLGVWGGRSPSQSWSGGFWGETPSGLQSAAFSEGPRHSPALTTATPDHRPEAPCTVHPSGAWGSRLRAVGPGVTARFLWLFRGRGRRLRGPGMGARAPSEAAAWASAISRSESVPVSPRDMGSPGTDRPASACH